MRARHPTSTVERTDMSYGHFAKGPHISRDMFTLAVSLSEVFTVLSLADKVSYGATFIVWKTLIPEQSMIYIAIRWANLRLAKHTVQKPETNGYRPRGVPEKNTSTMHRSCSNPDITSPHPYTVFRRIKSVGHEQSKLVQAQMTHICNALTSNPIVNHRHRCLIVYMGTFGIRRDTIIKHGCCKIKSS